MPTKPLQQIQRLEQTAIPPLSQSRHSDMGCAQLYALRHIDGIRGDSGPARRGSEIHAIIANYVRHLIKSRQKADTSRFDILCESVSPEALEVLETFRESFAFNPDGVVGTEIYISLDRGWQPSDEAVEYEGTLDLVTMESEHAATIHDWKSYFQIVDADSFQAKLYPLLLFSLNPSLQTIRFVLDFVRYGSAHRDVEYTREDVPKLKRLVETQRARQKSLHQQETFAATPGRHCSFCPKLTDLSCPLAETNPYATMTPAQRVGFAVFLQQAKKENDRLLKDMMREGGPVSYRDGNGVEYCAEFRKQDKRSYPLAKAFAVLNRWLEVHPADRDLSEKLTISGLSAPLKTKKRAALSEAMANVCEVNTITKFTVGRAGETEENGEE